MSDNKYKYKTEKEKKKCQKIINKLYGDNYYVYHSTFARNIESILKDGILKISNNIEKEQLNYGSTFYGYNIPSYSYCTMKFDDIKNMDVKELRPWFSLIFHPKILFENNIIFNKGWKGKKVKGIECDDKNSIDSIIINKEDNNESKIKTIKKMKEIIKNKQKYYNYYNSHEILFSKNINLKDYLIGISIYSYETMGYNYITNIMNKYGYDKIPLYKNEDIPSLCDILAK
jgi:hypothetical protein